MSNLPKLNILRSAKFLATIMGTIGIVAGLLYSIGGAIYDARTGALGIGTLLAFMAIIGMPLIFGVAGFISGAVVAFLYNILKGVFRR